MSYTTPIDRLLRKAQELSEKISSYTDKINTESQGAPPCFRTESTAALKTAKHVSAGSHLMPAIETLVTAIQACKPIIDQPNAADHIQAIEQHLGAIASDSACIAGVTSRFNSHYQRLCYLLEQFKILTSNRTDQTLLLDARDASIPDPRTARLTLRRDSFDASRPLNETPRQKILNWTRKLYEPLHTQLNQFIARRSTSETLRHGVNNYLREALRFTKISLDFYIAGGDSQLLSAAENMKKAEEMLGAVASWSPYFRIPCGAVRSELKDYYQSTCKLLEAAKKILPEPELSTTIRAQRPSLITATSASSRNIFTVRRASGSFRGFFSSTQPQPRPLSGELPLISPRDFRRMESVKRASAAPTGSSSASTFWPQQPSQGQASTTVRVLSPLYSGAALIDMD